MPSTPLQEVVCCLGKPVAGNPTQYMMEKAFAAAGLDWRYLTCEVPPEKLADAMQGIRALGFKGANFTIPHKVAVIQYLDELSPAAERGQELADLLGQRTSVKADFVPLTGEYVVPAETAILINATSVGLGDGDARLPVAVDSLRPDLIVADVVFNPPDTWLIRTAA